MRLWLALVALHPFLHPFEFCKTLLLYLKAAIATQLLLRTTNNLHWSRAVQRTRLTLCPAQYPNHRVPHLLPSSSLWPYTRSNPHVSLKLENKQQSPTLSRGKHIHFRYESLGSHNPRVKHPVTLAYIRTSQSRRISLLAALHSLCPRTLQLHCR